MRIDQFISGEVVDRLVDALLLVGLDGSIIDASAAALDLYGYPRTEMLSLSIRDIRAPQDLDDVDGQMRQSAQDGVRIEAEHLRSDGTPIAVEVRSAPVSADGETALLTVVRDIGDAKQAEEALRYAENRFRLLFDQDPDGVVIVDPETAQPLEFNETAHRQLGYTRKEFAGLSISDIEDIETPEETRARIDQVIREGRMDFDTRHRMKGGELRNVHVTAQLIEVAGQSVYHCVWRDVTDRVRDREQLSLSLSLTEAVLDSVDSGVLVVRSDGTVLRANRKFAALWRVPDDVLASNEDAKLLAHVVGQLSDPDGFIASTARLYDDPDAEAFDEIDFKDGRVFERSSRPMAVEGEPAGRVWSFRDITQRKQAEREVLRLNSELEERVQQRTEALSSSNEELSSTNSELTETNVRLEEATRAKSDFLAAMSHELRTPLNSINGFSGILLQGLAGPLNAEQERQVGMVRASGGHLLSLIEEILDLSRIEAGHSTAVFENVEVPGLVSDVLAMVRPLADAKGIGLALARGPGTDLLRSDPGHLRQILINLLGNAVKFTDSGAVSLGVSVENGQMLFAVNDTGRGIRDDEVPRIMDDFYQAEPTAEAKSAGAGLGLAISSRLAEALGGTLDVSSDFGVGSTFTLRVPGVIRPTVRSANSPRRRALIPQSV